MTRLSLVTGAVMLTASLTAVAFVGLRRGAPPGDPASTRARVEVSADDPTLGAADALLTAVVFVDYTCPQSKRALELARDMVALAPEDVRVVVRHLPLPTSFTGREAARAALAAQAQGKYFELADRLFADGAKLDRAALEEHAAAAGLDLERFRRDRDAARVEAKIARDVAFADRMGVTGTPAWFLNGTFHKGNAALDDRLEVVVQAELEHARGLVERGVARTKVYDSILASANASRPVLRRPAPPERLDLGQRYAVPVAARDARLGPEGAPVTMVAFLDVACPYSRTFFGMIDDLRARHGDRLRIVWKHFPLSRHPQAPLAHQALVAAQAQAPERTWSLAEALFARRGELAREAVLAAASRAGLDPVRFAADLDAPETLAILDEDRRLAGQFGVTGTPTLFVNGKPVRGSQPLAALDAVVKDELVRAEPLAAGVAPADVYAAVTKDALDAARAPEAPRLGGLQPDLAPRYRIPERREDPSRGAADALVTVVAFLDFECGPSAAAADALRTIEQRHPGKVRTVFRHNPLPFHANAWTAHAAAIAAAEQGRFWDMHDWLFAHQDQLEWGAIEQAARDLGLDTARFVRDYQDRRITDERMRRDALYAQSMGLDFTPVLFVNGQVIPGLSDVEDLDELVRAEIAAAEALLARGVPRSRLNDEILAGAGDDLATALPRAAEGAEDEAYEDDEEYVDDPL